MPVRAPTATTPEVSVIIPCLNEAGYVHRLLDDLARQSWRERLEVVVVDSASDDDTVGVARRYAGKLNLRLVAGKRQGPAAARNLGAAEARGAWLLFLDADVQLPDPRFVEILVGESARRELVTATSSFGAASRRIDDRLGAFLSQWYQRLLSLTQHPVACGFCILTRQVVFVQAQGFDRTLHVGEDYDYVSRSAGGRGPRRFDFISGTHFLVDVRRFEEGGRTLEFLKAIGYEVYRFTHGFKIQRDPFNYQFGHHGTAASSGFKASGATTAKSVKKLEQKK